MPVPQLPVWQGLPQPSAAPQALPAQAGVQPHWTGVPPPPQVWGETQLPVGQAPPQPSAAPQALPVQSVVQPHVPGVPPPPQVLGAAQVWPQPLQLASVPSVVQVVPHRV